MDAAATRIRPAWMRTAMLASRRDGIMRRLGAVAVSLMLVGVVAAGPLSTSAQGAGIPYVGEVLNLYFPPDEMAANAPFTVAHGNCHSATEGLASVLRPSTRFELYVDGAAVTMGTQIDLDYRDGCPYAKLNYHDFRVGLSAGAHTFDGVWFDPLLGGEYQRISVEVMFS
jgi:hypothetical protein